ncbi:MAG: VWA domain-containing protein [Rhodocyclaceae bacterium]|nr:VWA domain-containing protein [Rhodocyclaceae bacterium]
MNLSFDTPWLLLALPLALLPLLRTPIQSLPHPWLGLVPEDPLGNTLNAVLRVAAVLGIVALVLGLAGLARGERVIETVGTGAEIVVMLDRSRSMDQGFGRTVGYEQLLMTQGETKNGAARRVLTEFVKGRPNDAIGLLAFSTRPIHVLPLTTRHEVVQAAIDAAGLGRGLAETDIGLAMIDGLHYFDERPYTGSRVLLLVSDGGAQLDELTQHRIVEAARKHRVSLYWIYLRGRGSPGLKVETNAESGQRDAVPEYFLDRFFGEIGVPYRAYEAEDPQQLKAAVSDIDRLQRLPTRTTEVVPRQSLASLTFGLALLLLLPVVIVSALQVTRWSRSAAH